MTLVSENLMAYAFIALFLIGLYGALSKKNLVKKLMGLSIFQTAIILFYVSAGFKKTPAGAADIPIFAIDHHTHQIAEKSVELVINPLPHVLMLTAIVVGVATVGVGLAILLRIHDTYGSVEEDAILEKIVSQ